MTEVLHLNGSTSRERHAVTTAIDALLQSCGAAVTDYHQFSNVSVSVSFEVAAGCLARLGAALQECGVLLSEASLSEVVRAAAAAADHMMSGTVQVTFYHHEPDPYVPRAHASHRA
jgi:hypothetical protein